MSRLSKSRLTAFRQCAKRLWLEVNKRELVGYGPEVQHRFDVGHQVGEIARREYPNGILIEHDDELDRAIEETQAALSHQRPIFEATFRFEDLLVRADLLLPVADGWHMAEVKSTVSVKDYHLHDVAAQVWVARNSGVPITRATVRHIESSFIYTRPHDYAGLFFDADVLDDADAIMATLPQTVADAQAVLSGAEPDIRTGRHCGEPYGCPFHSYCRESEPPPPRYPVTLLPNQSGKKIAAELAADGFADLELAPADRITNLTLKRIYDATVSGVPYWDAAAAKETIDAWAWPRHFLDFETISPAVPIWIGSSPYSQAPFQFSCHTINEDGSEKHSLFLDLSGNDPSRACAEALLQHLGDAGTIVSYSAFEKTTIRWLAKRVPDLEPRLTALADRVVDLLPVVKAHFYHRDMMGSYSIKHVQPVLAPHLDYEALGDVKDGLSAQLAYLEAVSAGCTEARRAELKKKLEDYCALDTLSMVEVAGAIASGRRVLTAICRTIAHA